MTENRAVQISSGRYYQGSGALSVFPEEVQTQGDSVLIITDRTVYPKVRDRVEPALRKAGLRFEIFWFDGFCSAGNYEAAAQAARRMKAAVVAGIGGGRIMDTAKIASDLCRVRSITVPTSAATCAATALLAVHYTDDGHFLGNYWPAYVPSATIADLDVIVSDCPVRCNAAGIIDAMAKMPEITYNMRCTKFWSENLYSGLARAGAGETYRFLLENGPQVLDKMRSKICDQQVENSVCAALSATGLISCLASGGKQAAISHCLYSFFCDYQPELTRDFLHGELVGASLPWQLMVNGEEGKAEELSGFLRKMDLPACLDDLGFRPDPAELRELYQYLQMKMPIEDDSALQRLRAFEEVLLHGC